MILHCPLCNNCSINFYENDTKPKSLKFKKHQNQGNYFNYNSNAYYNINSPNIPSHEITANFNNNKLLDIYIYLDNNSFIAIYYDTNKIIIGNVFSQNDIFITLPLDHLTIDLDYFSIHNFIQTQLAFQ